MEDPGRHRARALLPCELSLDRLNRRGTMTGYTTALLSAVFRISLVLVAAGWALEKAGSIPQAFARDADLPVASTSRPAVQHSHGTSVQAASHPATLSPEALFGSARHRLPERSRFAR